MKAGELSVFSISFWMHSWSLEQSLGWGHQVPPWASQLSVLIPEKYGPTFWQILPHFSGNPIQIKAQSFPPLHCYEHHTKLPMFAVYLEQKSLEAK